MTSSFATSFDRVAQQVSVDLFETACMEEKRAMTTCVYFHTDDSYTFPRICLHFAELGESERRR